MPNSRFSGSRISISILMIIKFQNGCQNPIWLPTCRIICLSRSVIDIESKEICLIVVVRVKEFNFNNIWP